MGVGHIAYYKEKNIQGLSWFPGFRVGSRSTLVPNSRTVINRNIGRFD
jgi:hypothetical protein